MLRRFGVLGTERRGGGGGIVVVVVVVVVLVVVVGGGASSGVAGRGRRERRDLAFGDQRTRFGLTRRG